jgi:hypothetical protein
MRRTGNSPRGDNLDVWLETIESEFKSNLVVPLSCATMRNITRGGN